MAADGSTFPTLSPIERVVGRIPPHFSALERAAFLQVADDTPPTLRRLAAQEVTRAHFERRRHEQRSGVGWSGMSDLDPYTVASVDELVARAAQADAHAKSPRGQFVAALNALDAQGYHAEADKARSAYCRGFSDSTRPACEGEVANALLALNELAGNAARSARQALAEILLTNHVAEARGNA